MGERKTLSRREFVKFAAITAGTVTLDTVTGGLLTSCTRPIPRSCGEPDGRLDENEQPLICLEPWGGGRCGEWGEEPPRMFKRNIQPGDCMVVKYSTGLDECKIAHRVNTKASTSKVN